MRIFEDACCVCQSRSSLSLMNTSKKYVMGRTPAYQTFELEVKAYLPCLFVKLHTQSTSPTKPDLFLLCFLCFCYTTTNRVGI